MRHLVTSPHPGEQSRRGSVWLDPELVAIGVLGGLLSGLLGVGGGIVMVPLLVFWARYGQRDAHARPPAALQAA